MSALHGRALRLGVQVAALVVAVLAVVGLLALRLYEDAEHDAAERTLRQAVGRFTPSRAPEGFWVVRDEGDRLVEPPRLPVGLPVREQLDRVAVDGRARQEELEVASGTFFVRTERRGDAVVQVAMDRTAAEEAADRVIAALLAAGGVGVVLAAGVGAMLARRALRPLAEALDLQRRFVADAGHELRTPVTLLSTRVQLLDRKLQGRPGLADDVRADLAGVRGDTQALAELLDELLVAADPGARDERVPVDLARLVTECVESATAHAAQQGVRLEVEAAPPAEVPAVPAAVRRAITSLVENAVDHARSSVRVGLRVTRRQVTVEVTDDGPGVPPAEAERIFERFASTRPAAPDAAGRRHYGLGLALVADVATAHGGSVRVRGRADGEPGAVFELVLPR